MRTIRALLGRGLPLAALALALAACAPRQSAAPTPSPAAPSVVPATVVAPTIAPPAPTVAPTVAPLAPTTAPAGQTPGGPERISFAPGATSAAVEGAVIRGERKHYVLWAAAGQQMSLQLSTLEQNGALVLTGPDGAPLPGAAPGEDAAAWSGLLPATGDYLVEVGPTRGNATYRLTVSITTPTAPAGGLRSTDWSAALAAEPALDLGQQDGRPYVTVRGAAPPVAGIALLDAVVYGDFEGDGREDAAIMLASGGTAGNVGVLVFRDTGAGPGLAASRDGYKLGAAAEGGLLVLRQPIYAAWEPNCCPSGLATASYRLGAAGLEPVASRSEGVAGAEPQVVEAFYDLIRRGELAMAYALLDGAQQAANPYDQWAAGFASTVDLAASTAADPAAPGAVRVELTATDRAAGGALFTRRFAGTWQVRWDEARAGWAMGSP
ncbi:MAG TPA: hypothetical protein PKD53_05005, partial [Chloroflexaceae bacterium]|nr:hypothetical protein [Chloroflexaceae bacterium]